MPKKLTTITDEQKARFTEWVKKWTDIGLRTADPINVEIFTNAVRRCYKAAGLAFPEVVVKVSSPMVGALAAPIAASLIAILKKQKGAKGSAVGSAVDSAVYSAVRSAVRSSVGSAVGSSVGSAVRSSVGSAVDSAVDSSVRSAVDSAVYSAVRSAVRSAVDSAVYSAVRSAVRSAVGSAVDSAVYSAVDSAVNSAVDSAVYSAVDSAVRSSVDSAVNSSVYSAVDSSVRSSVDREKVKLVFWHEWFGGQFWSWWNSYVTFLLDVMNWTPDKEVEERARAYVDCSMESAYWWPNKDFVMVCERPSVIGLDSNGRLHSEEGKAIYWPDGWGLWQWHGVAVTEQIIMKPETITAALVDAEQNAEVRRIMIERMGAGKYLNEAGAKLIDMDSLTFEGSAPRALMEDKHQNKWMVGTDGSTKRVYSMAVPREAMTCVQAHNMIAGFDEQRLIAEC